MKTLLFHNEDNSVFVEYVTDLIDGNDALTIMSVKGLDSPETVAFGFKDKCQVSTLVAERAFATANNLTLDIYETDQAVIHSVTDIELAITTEALDAGTIDIAYSMQCAAVGGHGTKTWSATGLPTGLTIGAATGLISGTALDADDTYTVAITIEDAWGVSDTVELDLVMVASAKKEVLTYSVPEQFAAAVIATPNVTLEFDPGTALGALVATFTLSYGATAAIGSTAQESGTTPNDFTGALTYVVTAQDGTTKNWTITGTVMVITNASLAAATNDTAYSESITKTGGYTPYAYAATGLPDGVTCDPATGAITGTPLDTAGTFEVELSVTDNIGCVITKTLDIVLSASAKHEILTFSFPEETGAATIDADAHTVAIEVANGTSPLALVATFTLSHGGTAAVDLAAQESGVTANDFSNPVIYTVTAEDTTTQNWTITVTIAGA